MSIRSILVPLALGVLISAAAAEDVRGTASVVDGDTLIIGPATVRLFGIDAPESGQSCQDGGGKNYRCGKSATDRLQELTAGKDVLCSGSERDQYGRLLGLCEAASVKLNALLVREGHAWAFVRYSTAFANEEREARAKKIGVFAAENEPPWGYRARRWEAASRTEPDGTDKDCPIKGNISRKGERIYHLPWQLDYGRTRIDTGKGERWFCDEGEAVSAGWRKAMR